jgi:hypothetical protein
MPKPELEDYYYISDRKIDNYAAQISPGLAESLSAEIKADLGVVSSKLSTREPRTDRITRMRVVRDYIEKHYEIGKIDSPQLWVKDELSVRDIRLAANPLDIPISRSILPGSEFGADMRVLASPTYLQAS